MTGTLFFAVLALCFLGPGIHLNVQQWRQRKRDDFEYWLTCDPERHADWLLEKDGTKMELLGASVWRVKK